MKSYQVSFSDESQRLAALIRLKDPLEELKNPIDFEMSRPILTEDLRNAERKCPAGRKPLDVILMFKALIVQTPLQFTQGRIFSGINRQGYMQQEMPDISALR